MCEIFVALNFRGSDDQRNFFNGSACQTKWRLTSDLAAFEAITFGIASRNSMRLLLRHGRKRIDLFDTAPPGCTSCKARACHRWSLPSLRDSPLIQPAKEWKARAIPWGQEAEREPSRLNDQTCQEWMTVKNFRCCYISL